MSITLVCACGKRLTAKDELAGRKAKCPGCGKTLEIPAPTTPALQPNPVHVQMEGLSQQASSTFNMLSLRKTADFLQVDAFLETSLIMREAMGEEKLQTMAMLISGAACHALVSERKAEWHGTPQQPQVRLKNGIILHWMNVTAELLWGKMLASDLLLLADPNPSWCTSAQREMPPNEQILRYLKTLQVRWLATAQAVGEKYKLDGTPKSLSVVDDLLSSCWGDPPLTSPLAMAYALGAYMGLVITTSIPKSAWSWNEGNPAVFLEGNHLRLAISVPGPKGPLMLDPINWAYKRITNGEEDALAYKYAMALKASRGELS